MVRRWAASFSDDVPDVDCGVAELFAAGVNPARPAALNFWSRHPIVNANGRLLADEQFRVLAFAFRGGVAGARSGGQVHVRGRLSVFAIAARRRRLAQLAREPAKPAEKEGRDDWIRRRWARGKDRLVGHPCRDSAWPFPNLRALDAGSAEPQQCRNIVAFRLPGTCSRIARSSRSGVAARDLSLARHRASESAHLVRQGTRQDWQCHRGGLGPVCEIPTGTLAARSGFLAGGGWWVAAERPAILAGAGGGVDSVGRSDAVLASPAPRSSRAFHSSGGSGATRTERRGNCQ